MTYQPKTYRDNGGDRHVIGAGGILLIEGSVRGLTPGTDRFVDSVNGASGNDGLSWASPLLTIQAASTASTANNGDRIFVAPGHVETVSAAGGLALATAGVEIVFVGNGNDRGQIAFGTAVDADMDVSAADITMVNPRFVAAIDALTGPIDVNAARFRIIDGTWEDGTAINTTDCIVGDANADDCTIDGWTFIDGNAAGTQKQSQIQFAAATRPRLKRIRITGDFGTGPIENGTAWIDAELDDIIIDNTAAGPVVGILLQATSSGTARNVNVRVASGTTYVTANNDMQWFNCWGVGTDADAAAPIGTLEDTANNYLGADNANNAAATTNVTANADGSVLERLEALKDALTDTATDANKIDGLAMAPAPVAGSMARFVASGGTALGTELPDSMSLYDVVAPGRAGVLKVTIADGTTIPNNTQAAGGLLATATGGDCLIEEIIWQRGATNFTAATNLEFSTDNANGLTGAAAPNVVALLAKFNANVTSIASLDGSTKQLPFVLESTKKLYIHGGDAAPGAGGTTDFYIQYRPLVVGASLT